MFTHSPLEFVMPNFARIQVLQFPHIPDLTRLEQDPSLAVRLGNPATPPTAVRGVCTGGSVTLSEPLTDRMVDRWGAIPSRPVVFQQEASSETRTADH